MRAGRRSKFRRDVKRAKRRGKDLEKLWAVVRQLEANEALDQQHHHPHRLFGDWSGHWECHIEPDWLLIWTKWDGYLVLERTGSHSDLFG